MAVAAETNKPTAEFDYEARRYNDTVTWLAEVLPGHMRTPFEYSFDGRELYASDGSALERIFDDSIEATAGLEPGLEFELRRRHIEKDEYVDMLKMMRGELPNTMVVVSDFPPELEHASRDIGGYNVTRKQTMLRVLARTPEGMLKMYSQSLDGSDRMALEMLYDSLGFWPEPGELLGQRMHLELEPETQEFLVDQLTGIYDRALTSQYDGMWYAGRKGARRRDNTYDFVRAQSDLISAYLATTPKFMGDFKDLSLAAAMKDRFLGKTIAMHAGYAAPGSPMHALALGEMYRAGNQAQAWGEAFSACGITIGGQNASAEAQLARAGYGNQADKSAEGTEKLIWKDGYCRVDNCPTRPDKTKVAQCSVCRGCQSWFDKGRDPSKLYKGMKRVQKESFSVQLGRKKQTKVKKEQK